MYYRKVEYELVVKVGNLLGRKRPFGFAASTVVGYFDDEIKHPTKVQRTLKLPPLSLKVQCLKSVLIPIVISILILIHKLENYLIKNVHQALLYMLNTTT